MSTTKIEQAKQSLLEALMDVEDLDLIQKVTALLKGSRKDKLEDSINRGYEQSEKGLGRPHHEVMKELQEKYF